MKEKILYLECNSGISGDMTVAALLDLGADRQTLLDALNSLPLSGYSIEIKDVFKSGIRACDFNVILEHDNHDHDMQYLHGAPQQAARAEHLSVTAHVPHSEEPVHTHSSDLHTHAPHPEEPVHTHSSDLHTHAPHSEEPVHAHSHHADARNLNDITQIIQAGRLSESARTLALRIFRILAQAEASVHGKSIDEVHFHEVGAIDSIVDIVAAAVCIDNLKPDSIVVSALTDGTGQIRCQHGIIPVPVPAVAAIAANEQIILKTSSVEGELVTPTGAAIAAAAASRKALPDEYRICRIGLGAGKREYASTGLLRAMLIEPAASDEHDTIAVLETNIDDCTGEALSYTMQLLFDAGALDVFCVPIYMKKNRPAYLLKVICQKEDRERMESVIFRNTTTIGVRYQEMRRTRLERRIETIETPWGMADIKCCTYKTETYYYPESDSICRLAAQNGIGFSELYTKIQACAEALNTQRATASGNLAATRKED